MNSNKNDANSQINTLETKVNNNKGNADSKINSVNTTVYTELLDKLNDRDLDARFFSVWRENSDVAQGSTITYSGAIINHRSGMDTSTGIFTAPRSGVYLFSFSGQTENDSGRTKIDVMKVKKNGGDESKYVTIMNDADKDYHNIGYTWMMNLVAGDQMYMKVVSNALQCVSQEYLWLTGEFKWHK